MCPSRFWCFVIPQGLGEIFHRFPRTSISRSTSLVAHLQVSPCHLETCLDAFLSKWCLLRDAVPGLLVHVCALWVSELLSLSLDSCEIGRCEMHSLILLYNKCMWTLIIFRNSNSLVFHQGYTWPSSVSLTQEAMLRCQTRVHDLYILTRTYCSILCAHLDLNTNRETAQRRLSRCTFDVLYAISPPR